MSSEKKIRSPRALKRLRKSLSKTKRVVFTNGCFDILHPGHVTYLEKARKLGDILVVAINSSESVQRLKGPSRPINSLEDRMRVMAGLECVSYVTWFEDDTPENLIHELCPNVLVKGGDWKPEQIVGSSFVLAQGGKVRSLPFVEGKSTTSIIEKAKLKRT